MGSQSFTSYSRGKDARDAYTRAVEEAEYEYGHQEGYSGAINSTAGFGDITREFKASKKSLNQFIDEQMDKLTKYDGARCICLEEPIANTNVTKSQVEHIVTPGTKKWVLKFVVRAYRGVVSSHNTKGDAVKAARAYTEKNQESTGVYMEKTLEKNNPQVAKITYKKSSKEREGRWIFFGWASC
jgi:hypothetical protein